MDAAPPARMGLSGHSGAGVWMGKGVVLHTQVFCPMLRWFLQAVGPLSLLWLRRKAAPQWKRSRRTAESLPGRCALSKL